MWSGKVADPSLPGIDITTTPTVLSQFIKEISTGRFSGDGTARIASGKDDYRSAVII